MVTAGADDGLDIAGGAQYAVLSNERSTQKTSVRMKKPSPSSRVSQQKLQVILRHAAQVFSEKGYEGASIRDISRSSGVSLAGLYYYVESKQKLLYLIQLCTFKTVLERLEKRLAGVADPLERLRILIRNHLDYFLRHPVEMKVLSHEDEALEGDYRKEVLELKRRYYDIALGTFEELRRAGLARRLNSRVAVLSLFGMMNWIYTWHRPRLDPGADAMAETIAGMFLHGVMNGQKAARSKVARIARSNGVSARARAAV
jgi:TetR/AcrR family transcriptional regulator, cholesterol catabolism regulator